MARRFPDKLVKYAAEQAATEELPILIDHLDAYVAGVKEAREVGRIKPGRESEIEELLRLAREGRSWLQDTLLERGWKLGPDAKTWVAP